MNFIRRPRGRAMDNSLVDIVDAGEELLLKAHAVAVRIKERAWQTMDWNELPVAAATRTLKGGHRMDEQANFEPVVLPDVATEPHPVAHAPQHLAGDGPAAGEGVLQEALPAIREAARQVGGLKRLAEIAGQLDRDGKGR
jgi:hypothetical protein